jgi:hypothetical protein
MSLAQIGPCHSIVVNFGYVFLDEFVTFNKRRHFMGGGKHTHTHTFLANIYRRFIAIVMSK